MATTHPESLTAPWVDERALTRDIALIPLAYPSPRAWWIGFGISGLGVLVFLVSVGWLFYAGTGVWGINSPEFWGLAISNYVWWIGMGHAGTLISALLLIINKGWRNSLNRFAEAMTVFAVIQAALYPILHLGRPWLFYWLIPYPNTMAVWPQFKSPLVWDVFAVGTYLIVSVMFWYVGLIPDLASVRDRAKRRLPQVFFGLLALGWRNSAVHWQRWQVCYWILAGLALPLVISVHSGVAMLFAVGIEPGWHTTIYPPYFVIGAVFEGFAVVLLISITLRHAFGLHHLVTDRHLDMLAKLLLAFGLMTLYGYVFEAFGAWYSGDLFERQTLYDRWYRDYAWSYWGAIVCNFVVLQALWFRAVRRRPALLILIGVSVAVGMWLERFMLVVTTLYRDFLPSSYQAYVPSFWEWSLFAGTIGLFFFLFFLFVRLLPMISMFELKEVLHEEARGGIVPSRTDEYALLAEFDRAEALLAAAGAIRQAGYRAIDAFSPFPLEGLAGALGFTERWLPLVALAGGVAGGFGGFLLQFGLNAWDYPINVGGRPLDAWPAFAVTAFEMTVLGAALAVLLGLLVLCRLPRLNHPVFESERFKRVTVDRFFLVVRSDDPRFDEPRLRQMLEQAGAVGIEEVPA